MPSETQLSEHHAEIVGWRHHLHANPEILYEVHDTAAFVAERLREFGCDEVVPGLGRTGVVAVIEGRGPGRSIGLRTDMDALPIEEETNLAYRSVRRGSMHACGHDGHMAMMLGAARALCRSRAFDGRVVLIFQPAEEGGAGAKAMLDDGLFQRFPVDAVFGMHNLPGLEIGQIATRPGAIMASTDEFAVTLRGRGGHAALPHLARDPILGGATFVQGLQQIVSRSTDPLEALVVSVTQFHSGFTLNVIPEDAVVSGTVRSLSAATRDLAEERIRAIAAGVAASCGLEATVDYDRNYPVTMNDGSMALRCADVAGRVARDGVVDAATRPLMAGEDFSYMLEQVPGALVFLGNGASAPLHNPSYDFDDRALPYGIAYWLALVDDMLGGTRAG